MTSKVIPAAEYVYRQVKARILAGSLAAGSMTSEGEIATELGVSRTPVREGFLRLEAEGLLSLFPKRGALVSPIGAHEADEIFEARMLIESHSAERLVGLSEAQLSPVVASLGSIVDEQSRAVADADVSAYIALDMAFHQDIVVSGANSLLSDFAVGLRERQQRLMTQSVRWDLCRAEAFIEDHRGLLEAVRNRDLPEFRILLTRHLDTARSHV